METIAVRRSVPVERRDLLTRGVCDAVAASLDLHPSSLAPLEPGVVFRIAQHIGIGPGGTECGRGVLEVGGLRIDLAARTVHRNGRSVHLSVREFDVLAVLARGAGRVIRRDQLLRQLWRHEDAEAAASLYVHVCRLRAKLQTPKPAVVLITTVVGVGYRLDHTPPLGRASNSKGYTA